MNHQRFVLALLLWLFAAMEGSVAAAPSDANGGGRVLFVGNSLTYVGNLPAVFDALSGRSESDMASDMIVAPGATLTERVADGTVERALATRKYRFVVLQERGGDLACGFGPQVCANAQEALRVLAHLARTYAAKPILLGTYQGTPAASRRVASAEAAAAAEVGIPYVRVAEPFMQLRDRNPRMSWFAADGMHPGADLTLLEAILLFREVCGSDPSVRAISVRAPIYSFHTPLKPELRSSHESSDLPGVSKGISYESTRMVALLEVSE